MKQPRTLPVWVVATLFLGFGTIANAAIETVVIRIDSSTIQPIATGLVPGETGELIVIAEGSIQPFPNSTRFTDGNFGADGETRLSRGGQPISDGMPYGAVIGRFGNEALPSYQFLGDTGVTSIDANDLGDELKLALNMSDADLANSTGSLVVTLIMVPDGAGDVAEVTLFASSAYPVATGLIAGSGDDYVTLAMGAIKQPLISGDAFVDGWFGPAGKLQFNRSGQPRSEGPYGGVYATYSGPTAGFFLGSAGSWNAQPSDLGLELSLFLNMSETDQAAINGAIRVWVIRLAESTSSAENGDETPDLGAVGYPNPSSGPVQLRYTLPASDKVLLRVYDTSGRLVRTLVDGAVDGGVHEVQWDGAGQDGEAVASGTYFYQLTTSNGSDVGRVVVAR